MVLAQCGGGASLTYFTRSPFRSTTSGLRFDLLRTQIPPAAPRFQPAHALLGAPQRVLSRDQLLEMSRLYDDEVYDRSIDVQILRLRRKIEANPSEPQFIATERGAGYIFSVPVEVLY